MDYVVNGELFVKNHPDVFNADKSLTGVRDKIHDLEFETSKENPDLSVMSTLEDYQKLNDRFTDYDGKLDYSNMDKFWQLVTNGKEYELRVVSKYSFEMKSGNAIRHYNSLDDLRKDFTSLREFLDKSTFVGREFKRTKPIINEITGKFDKSYMHDIGDNKEIVLYATQELFLVRSFDEILGNKYELINSKYVQDGNYEFFGPIYDEYKDKTFVYQEIMKQLNLIEEDKRKSK